MGNDFIKSEIIRITKKYGKEGFEPYPKEKVKNLFRKEDNVKISYGKS